MPESIYQLIKYSAVLIFAFLISSCDSQKNGDAREETEAQDLSNMSLSIKVKNPQQGPLVLMKPEGRSLLPLDTLAPEVQASMTLDMETPEHGMYILNIANRQYVNLVITGEDLAIEAGGDNMADYAHVTGSLEMDRFTEAKQLNQDFQASMQEMQQQLATAIGQGEHQKAQELQNTFMQMAGTYQQDMEQMILSWGASLSGAYLVFSLPQGADYEMLSAITAAWEKKSKPYPQVVQDIMAQADALAKTRIGAEAPAIEQANPEGEMVALSSLRGKYVLIDFWASWCKPCRQENPNTVRAYQNYKDKGFEVYAVSLDQDKEKWLRAIAEDGLTWTQVSDLLGYNAQPAKDYGINAIPATFLLDPEGKIIAKDLRGFALEQKLQEVLGE